MFFLAPLVAVVVIACGGSDDETAPANTPVASVSATAPAVSSESPASNTPAAQASDAAATDARLNLNTATGDEFLAGIPEFSDRFVREFLEYRPYVSIQEFERELRKYVDDAQIAVWEEYVYVPVEVNDSDAETLQQLPGVSAAVADELIAARPFDSNDDFLTELAARVSTSDAAAAEALLSD